MKQYNRYFRTHPQGARYISPGGDLIFVPYRHTPTELILKSTTDGFFYIIKKEDMKIGKWNFDNWLYGPQDNRDRAEYKRWKKTDKY